MLFGHNAAMISRAFFHYLLACTVLFVSSLAAFHGSEHIGIEKTNSTIASADHLLSEYHPHSHVEPEAPENDHSIESLCDECLVLSNLIAHGLDHSFIGVLPAKTKYRLHNLVDSKSQAFHTYLSRAPPLNV